MVPKQPMGPGMDRGMGPAMGAAARFQPPPIVAPRQRQRRLWRAAWSVVSWPFAFVLRFLGAFLSSGLLRFLAMLVTWAGGLVAVSSLVAGALFLSIASTVPDPSMLYRYRPVVATQVSSQYGEQQFRLSKEYRLFVAYEDMPELLIYAFLAAEDQRFFDHKGVDGVSLMRAVLQNVQRVYLNQRSLGGSTITQQVAKIYVGSERSFARKLREAIFAAKLEQRLSKQQILEIYLNEIFFGVNTYGIGAATERYFGKTVDQLELADIAFLAALPKGPSNYHPLRQPEAAKERRDWIISRLLELGAISELDAQFASAQPLPSTIHYGLKGLPSSYFDLEIRRELEERFGEKAVYARGLQVETSLEPELQTLAQTVMQTHILRLDAKMGYRGPLAQIDLGKPDWVQRFLALEVARLYEGWQPVVVTASDANRADILFRSGKKGQLRLADLAWARPYRAGGVPSAHPGRVDAILAPGDVVLVEPIQASSNQTAQDANPKLLSISLDVRERLSEALPRYALRQQPLLSGAAVMLDVETAQIKALVGGFSPSLSKFNRATQAYRQPGSTIKPFVALAALEAGYTASSRLQDTEVSISLANGEDWTPSNFDGGYWGGISLGTALTYSRNVPMVRLYQSLGLQRISDTMMRLGLYDAPLHNPSAVLGANETSVLRLAAAYAAVANKGRYRKPTTLTRVRDADGVLLFAAHKEAEQDCLSSVFCMINPSDQAVSVQAAEQLDAMLLSVMQQGTGRKIQAEIDTPVRGKTGTTNRAQDVWFVGYDDHMVIAVFLGYDTPRSLGGHATGGGLAGPIFRDLYLTQKAWREGALNVDAYQNSVPPSLAFALEDPAPGLTAGLDTTSGATGDARTTPEETPARPTRPTTSNRSPNSGTANRGSQSQSQRSAPMRPQPQVPTPQLYVVPQPTVPRYAPPAYQQPNYALPGYRPGYPQPVYLQPMPQQQAQPYYGQAPVYVYR